ADCRASRRLPPQRCSSPSRPLQTCIPTPYSRWMPLMFPMRTATTATPTLSLHDALPILRSSIHVPSCSGRGVPAQPRLRRRHPRSEEHTSELQSHLNLVCRLLLDKKKRMILAGDTALLTALRCSRVQATRHGPKLPEGG